MAARRPTRPSRCTSGLTRTPTPSPTRATTSGSSLRTSAGVNLPQDLDTKALIDKVNRSDLWKEAAIAIGQEGAIPASDSRGKETFFDGVVFDPENPKGYLDSLKIKALS